MNEDHRCKDKKARRRQTNDRNSIVILYGSKAYLQVHTQVEESLWKVFRDVRIHYCPFCGVKL